jgi:hypothetical protein
MFAHLSEYVPACCFSGKLVDLESLYLFGNMTGAIPTEMYVGL